MFPHTWKALFSITIYDLYFSYIDNVSHTFDSMVFSHEKHKQYGALFPIPIAAFAGIQARDPDHNLKYLTL